MERVRFADWKRRVSWGSIFGGVVTVMAISVLLAILASSISFFMLDPTSDSPMSGIGTNVGIWTVVALIISFAAGGFVAGKLAGADGYIHGFLVWATTTILTVIMTISLASSVVKMAGNILGSVGSVAGNVISGVGSAVGDGVSGLAEQVFNIDSDGNIDAAEVRQDVRQALRRSGVAELQPDYIQRQFNTVRSDFQRSLRRLVMNPNDADAVINNFAQRTDERMKNAFGDIDRNDLTRAIANNTSMSQAEVNRAVDEYIELYNNLKVQAQDRIQDMQDNIQQAKQDWEELKVNAREEANKVANAAGRSTLWSFIALLIGGCIASFMGHYGTRKTREGVEA